MDSAHATNASNPDELTATFSRLQHAARREPMPGPDERIARLDALAAMIRGYQQDIIEAISADFGHRAAYETKLLEWMPLLDEIAHIRRHLRGWMKPRRISANWTFWPSTAGLHPQPLGVVGVIGAWNYPLQLTLSPAANALAAGNRVMLKPSEHAPRTAALLQRVIAENFAPEVFSVVTGDAEVSAAFSALPFDHLLFTGSTRVGRKVMQAAAEKLTPVTLELGGKSPAIIQADFPLAEAADRIASAKFWNAGQTCIAPDYVLLPKARVEEFTTLLTQAIERRWPLESRDRDYTSMIDAKAHARMQMLVDDASAKGARIMQAWPGDRADTDGGHRVFPPTVIADATVDMQVMDEEIFGPLLPLVGYDTLEDALDFVRARDRPLALYYFDHDATRIRHTLDTTHAGGVTLNDCMFHFAQHRLPFGGIGASGMGVYHGEAGFNRFSHMKPVLRQSGLTAKVLGRLIRPPYGRQTDRLIRLLAGRK